MDELVKMQLLKLDIGRELGLGLTSGDTTVGYKVVGSKPVGVKGTGSSSRPKPVVSHTYL